MSNEEMKKELERLRAEVEALSASRAREAEQANDDDTGAANRDASTTDASLDTHKVKSQVDELLELLETEVRDLPTITCLVVFSLGILMGRFMR